MGDKLRVAIWKSLVDKGIGGLLAPLQAKRMTLSQSECTRLNLLALAQAEQEVSDIQSGKATYQFETGRLLRNDLNDASDNGRFEPFIGEHLVSNLVIQDAATSLRKNINVSKAAIFAESCLMDDKQDNLPTDRINDDWLFLWKEYAGRVSQSELQELWGKLLANEFKAPGTFSLRTLDFLKTLDKREASLICTLGAFVLNRVVIDLDSFTLPLTFEDLLNLNTLGITESIPNSVKSGLHSDYQDRFYAELQSINKKIILTHDDSTRRVAYSVIPVSALGVEILKLANISLDEDYLRSLLQHFTQLGFNVEIEKTQ